MYDEKGLKGLTKLIERERRTELGERTKKAEMKLILDRSQRIMALTDRYGQAR
jgi:hypothetical protein